MTYFPIQPKIQVYIDSLGDPLDDGYIYFGKANLDPTLYPAKVSWDESGLYPVEFPVRTMNGYPLRNNVPAQMFINQEDNYEFSVLINDEDEVEVFSSTTEGLVGYFPSTGTGGDADTLEGHPASYFAVDSLAAHLAGAETFTGEKTFDAIAHFSSDIFHIVGSTASDGSMRIYHNSTTGIFSLTPYSSGAIVPTRQLLYDDSTGEWEIEGAPTIEGNTIYHTGNDGTLAHLAGAETFTGVKTFVEGPILSNNKAYSAFNSAESASYGILGINSSNICNVGTSSYPTNVRSSGTLQYNGTTLASGTIDTTATQTITVVDGLITSIV